jgi:hypothetical protein
MDNIHLSVIIVNYNVPDDVRKCILSLKDNARDIIYEVIVVDNNSVLGNIEDALKGLDTVQLLRLRAKYGCGFLNLNQEPVQQDPYKRNPVQESRGITPSFRACIQEQCRKAGST